MMTPDDDYAETLVLPSEAPDDDFAETLVLPGDELASRRREKPRPPPALSLPQVRRLIEAAALRQASRKLPPRTDLAVVPLAPPSEPRE